MRLSTYDQRNLVELLHPRGGEDGHDIARPAEFLVDAAGIIRWVNLTENIRVRARPEAVLKAIDDLLPEVQ